MMSMLAVIENGILLVSLVYKCNYIHQSIVPTHGHDNVIISRSIGMFIVWYVCALSVLLVLEKILPHSGAVRSCHWWNWLNQTMGYVWSCCIMSLSLGENYPFFALDSIIWLRSRHHTYTTNNWNYKSVQYSLV